MIYSKLKHNIVISQISDHRPGCFGLRFQLHDCKIYLMEHGSIYASIFLLIDSAILIISFYR